MPKEDWGVKRLCPTTGKRFYDLNRTPIISPYTGEEVVLETGRKSSVSLTRDKKAAPADMKEDVTDAEDVVLDDDDDADVDLADDVLDDDDDDDTVALDDLKDVASEDDDS
ncbi:TIGR02300 family protein [Dinoroseobacter sp. S76]|uniref:TIGR02300 family protein n=1 Tax=Dinoroseobacter sp. S76 TaxID=3415124 RepID=UPI003C7A380E